MSGSWRGCRCFLLGLARCLSRVCFEIFITEKKLRRAGFGSNVTLEAGSLRIFVRALVHACVTNRATWMVCFV